jgi:hypothetical protein
MFVNRFSEPPQPIPAWLGWAHIDENAAWFRTFLSALDWLVRPLGFRAGFSAFGNNGQPDDGRVRAIFIQRP